MKKLKKILIGVVATLSLFVSVNAYADNLSNCKEGYSTCNKSLLSDSELDTVKQLELARNVFACRQGFSTCNQSLLNETDKEAVRVATASRNYAACKQGSSNCNQSLLSNAEKQAIQYDSNKANNNSTSYSAACAENGSCYGDISDVNGLPKTNLVNGYTRKDGTYVRGYYRSRK
jgi:hypothetical protein